MRSATWTEIDLDKRVWSIPGEALGGGEGRRMKAGKDLRVPLSDAAVDLLAKVLRIKGADLVFPSSNNKPLGDMTLTAVMRRMGVDAVPRVMRATFKGHGRERTVLR